MSEIPAGEELLDLAFTALDHAVGSVAKAGGPMTPFVLADTPEGRKLARFVAGRLEESLAHAREAVAADAEAQRAAIAYDGYLTVEGERSDAIFVEAQERGREAVVVLAQRYRPGGRLRKFATIGNPAFMGPGEPLF